MCLFLLTERSAAAELLLLRLLGLLEGVVDLGGGGRSCPLPGPCRRPGLPELGVFLPFIYSLSSIGGRLPDREDMFLDRSWSGENDSMAGRGEGVSRDDDIPSIFMALFWGCDSNLSPVLDLPGKRGRVKPWVAFPRPLSAGLRERERSCTLLRPSRIRLCLSASSSSNLRASR